MFAPKELQFGVRQVTLRNVSCPNISMWASQVPSGYLAVAYQPRLGFPHTFGAAWFTKCVICQFLVKMNPYTKRVRSLYATHWPPHKTYTPTYIHDVQYA